MRQKAVFTLAHAQARARALNAVRGAPDGFTVIIEEPKRSLDQNALWWPLLTEISLQAVHPETGARLAPEVWRLILLDALGMEQASVESLDGGHRIPLGLSSSKLGKARFSELIELTYAVGAQLGVLFHCGQGGGGANNASAEAA